MLPADVEQLLQTLKNASFAVKRLSAKRNAPNDYRKAVEQLNWKTQPIVLDEILVLRNAAAQVVKALNDGDIKSGWVGPVPWQTIYRHATNALGWLDKFQSDITEYVATQDPKLVRSVEHYERFKLTMVNSIDDVFGQATRAPRLETVPYWRKVAANWMINLSMGIAGLTGCANHVYSEEPKQEAKDVGTITDEQITALMKYETVEEILKEDKIIPAKFEYVTYDEKTKTNNYDKLVFQEDLKKEDRKPVLAFFYRNKDLSETKIKGSAHRDAIIMKSLQQKYGAALKYVCFDMDSDKIMSAQQIANKFDIKTSPSILIHSIFDCTKGETPEKNDGKIKKIDALRGGPANSKETQDIFVGLADYLIKTNLTEINGESAWRLQNSLPWKWEKISYSTK